MRDPQNETPVCECCHCGGEIYRGDLVWEVDEGMLHLDADCVFGYIADNCVASDVMRSMRIPQVTA